MFLNFSVYHNDSLMRR